MTIPKGYRGKFKDVIDFIEEFLKSISTEQRPIYVVGASFGGLLAQAIAI